MTRLQALRQPPSGDDREEGHAMNVTELFLDHLDKMATSTWPKAAMDRARQSLIDYLAVTTAGYRSEQARWTPYLEARKGDVSVIGSRKKIQALDAAFVNGFNAHVASSMTGTVSA